MKLRFVSWIIAIASAGLLAAESRQVVFDGAVSEHKWTLKELSPDLPSDWTGYGYLVLEMRTSSPQRFLHGVKPGNLYVRVHVALHRFFKRKDDDIFYELSIPYSEAVNGGIQEVPTLEERIKIQIPTGSDSGSFIRLSGKGMPHLHGGRGDMYVKLKVNTPKKLTPRQKKLIEELKKEGL